MLISQKIKINRELTTNAQIVVNDNTGTFNPSNPNGYRGNYDIVYFIDKYIFELTNLDTGESYMQIQSNNKDIDSEYTSPSVERIINKENVYIIANNFEITSFPDGVYKLWMTVKLTHTYSGEGFTGHQVIVNVPGAESLFNNYGYIVAGNEIYKITNAINGTLLLDRPIVENFITFNAGARSSIVFILSDKLTFCINKQVANLADDCGCDKNEKVINVLSELQLYNWGIQNAIDSNDMVQAIKLFHTSKKLCSNLDCNCNG